MFLQPFQNLILIGIQFAFSCFQHVHPPERLFIIHFQIFIDRCSRQITFSGDGGYTKSLFFSIDAHLQSLLISTPFQSSGTSVILYFLSVTDGRMYLGKVFSSIKQELSSLVYQSQHSKSIIRTLNRH